MTSTVIVIPARYHSTRLPGKPCLEFDGVPMVHRVYVACVQTGIRTIVSSDSHTVLQRIPEEDRWFDDSPYRNGTERVAGISHKIQADNYINVQGDMIDITPEIITKVAAGLEKSNLVTAYTDLPEDQKNDPSTVKLIRAKTEALWFGRGITGYGDWHLGIYGYRRDALVRYRTYTQPPEELIENLEQLRWLKNSCQIDCVKVQYSGIEINTPDDVSKWNERRLICQ